jgi:type VI secretion system Hcp family effector
MRTGKKSGHPSGLILKVMLLTLAFSLLVASGAYAYSTDLFVRFAGIKGESTDENHKDWSNIQWVNWGISIEVPTHGAGRATFDDLVWSQLLDKSFPQLFADAAAGKHIQDVTVDFTFRLNGETATYFQMEFREVILTSLELTGKSGESTTFMGSFAYDRIEMIYTEYDEMNNKKGTIRAQYDVAKNVGSAGELGALYALGLSGPRIAVIPLPPSFMLLGSGLLGLAGWRWKFKG